MCYTTFMHYERIRRPRHTRVPFDGHVLSPCDLEILKQLHHYRLLTTRQLALIFGRKTVVKNLRGLFHNGYVDKPPAQRFFRNTSTIYALADRGARELGELGYPRALRDHSKQNAELRPWTLPHYLLIAEIVIALERACRQRSDVHLVHADELFSEQPNASFGRIEPVRLETEIEEEEGRKRPASLIPDGLVVLMHADRPDEPKLLFIEADCATQPVTRSDRTLASIERKLTTYRAYGRAKGNQAEFGINNFRTLFVTTGNGDRVRSFVESDQKLGGGQGSSRFLFTTEADLESDDLLAAALVNGRGERVTIA